MQDSDQAGHNTLRINLFKTHPNKARLIDNF